MEMKVSSRGHQGGELHLDSLRVDEKTNLRRGNGLISHMYTAIKAGQLYDPTNEGFTNQMDKLMKSFLKLFQDEESISLEVYMHSLFFNRVKIKTEFQNYLHTRFIIETLKKRDTEGLFFIPELTKDELSQFILLLVDREKHKEISFDEFQFQLRNNHIEHISIHQFSAATKRHTKERLLDIRRQAKRTFFESIYNLKGIMFKGKSEQRICTRRVRRLVQSIVDLIAEDESYLIGLTTMKHYDHYLLNHSVNVCVLSVALGQRLTSNKDALKELGLAGLFHDIGKIPNPITANPDEIPSWDISDTQAMRHPVFGVERLMQMKGLGILPVRAMKAILEHHLNFDLSGYPSLTKRTNIDLFSRIISIANHFDAATTHQPESHHSKTPDQILLNMLAKSGTLFDPVLLRLFIYMVGLYPVGSLVALNTGELGIVLQSNIDPALLDRPVVKLIGDHTGLKTDGEIVDLTDGDQSSGTYTRSVVKGLDHRKYNVDVFSVVTQYP
jgi:HD-GYP domain-containing protein (c-di-GMP phosphodiesterase class II)